ncbi:CDP-diacylglycerol--glycerol-3-phosphate 3-phosphatidyltransferase [Akkermansia sp.]|uniref:CDP-diacylglycerol--glycerol-3-phosphate 3-phosphatidyltransferase n=1 Tax=Akkermansia sp. TaxID=1872421 RepID=UPI0025C0E762|nr:CDP-diacylglycerol--glycerol-3-phosphate 3-phosphatidyltransferase [Akkermansia sp.]
MLNLPNAITLTRIALVVVFTAAVSIADQYSWGYLAALVTFILAACTDWLDGYLARRLNQVTTFGKLIDPLADKIAVSAAFIYLTGVGLCPVWVTILIISREFLVTGLRQIAQDHGVIIPAGTSGKWKTAFQLAFCIASLLALTWTHTPEYLPSFLAQLAALCLWHGSGASNFLYQFTLWGSIILTVYSGAVYCVGARKFLQR